MRATAAPRWLPLAPAGLPAHSPETSVPGGEPASFGARSLDEPGSAPSSRGRSPRPMAAARREPRHADPGGALLPPRPGGRSRARAARGRRDPHRGSPPEPDPLRRARVQREPGRRGLALARRDPPRLADRDRRQAAHRLDASAAADAARSPCRTRWRAAAAARVRPDRLGRGARRLASLREVRERRRTSSQLLEERVEQGAASAADRADPLRCSSRRAELAAAEAASDAAARGSPRRSASPRRRAGASSSPSSRPSRRPLATIQRDGCSAALLQRATCSRPSRTTPPPRPGWLELARQYPDLHVGTGYTFDQGQNKWALGLSIDLPLLDQNQGPIAEAEAARDEAAARFVAIQAAHRRGARAGAGASATAIANVRRSSAPPRTSEAPSSGGCATRRARSRRSHRGARRPARSDPRRARRRSRRAPWSGRRSRTSPARSRSPPPRWSARAARGAASGRR